MVSALNMKLPHVPHNINCDWLRTPWSIEHEPILVTADSDATHQSFLSLEGILGDAAFEFHPPTLRRHLVSTSIQQCNVFQDRIHIVNCSVLLPLSVCNAMYQTDPSIDRLFHS